MSWGSVMSSRLKARLDRLTARRAPIGPACIALVDRSNSAVDEEDQIARQLAEHEATHGPVGPLVIVRFSSTGAEPLALAGTATATNNEERI